MECSSIAIPCLLSNPSRPPRDAFSSRELRSIFALFLSLPQFHFLASFSHLLSKLTNEEDKEWGGGRAAEGGGEVGGKERDRELIRLEKHAGLDTLLMSTTKASSCVSGGM